jgi:hypothetical protein
MSKLTLWCQHSTLLSLRQLAHFELFYKSVGPRSDVVFGLMIKVEVTWD